MRFPSTPVPCAYPVGRDMARTDRGQGFVLPQLTAIFLSVGPSRLASAVRGCGIFSVSPGRASRKPKSWQRGNGTAQPRSSECSSMSTSLDSMGGPSTLPVTRSPTGGSSQPDFLPRHRVRQAPSLFESSLRCSGSVTTNRIRHATTILQPQPYLSRPRWRGEAGDPPDFSAAFIRVASWRVRTLLLVGDIHDRSDARRTGLGALSE